MKNEPEMDSEGQIDIHSMEVSLWRIRPRREISKEKGSRISWRLLRNRSPSKLGRNHLLGKGVTDL